MSNETKMDYTYINRKLQDFVIRIQYKMTGALMEGNVRRDIAVQRFFHKISRPSFSTVFPFLEMVIYEPPHYKTNKVTVRPAKTQLRSAWASAQSDQSLRCALSG